MSFRSRLTAATLLAATTFGLIAAAPAGAEEIPTPVKDANKTFMYTGFTGDTPYNTESFAAPGAIPIVGQFAGNTAEDIFWYTAGAGGDALNTNDGTGQFTSMPQSVNGTYTPYVGTFTQSDGIDDILWYSKTGPSQIWDFNADGQIIKSSWAQITGEGQILIGDFALDGVLDVVRYRPGSASDSWWDLQPAGLMSRPFNVNGTYKPLVGTFGTDAYDDILWYAAGPNPDSLWDFTGGGAKTEWKLSINGTFTPVVGRFSTDNRDDVVWYAPGGAADSLWNFDGVGYTTKALSINGTYVPVACYCLQSGSALEDIVWFGPGNAADTAWKVTGNNLAYTSVGTNIYGGSIAAKGSFTVGSVRELLLVRPSAQ